MECFELLPLGDVMNPNNADLYTVVQVNPIVGSDFHDIISTTPLFSKTIHFILIKKYNVKTKAINYTD